MKLYSDNYIFINQKNKDSRVPLPEDYQIDEKSIPGVYLTSSIRFYRYRWDELFTHENLKKLYPEKNVLERTKIKRKIYSSMADFDIEDNKIRLTGLGTTQSKDYDFSSGLYIVKNSHFMDVVEKNKIGTYIDQYGFDPNIEEEIINNEVSVFPRTPGRSLKFTLKN